MRQSLQCYYLDRVRPSCAPEQGANLQVLDLEGFPQSETQTFNLGQRFAATSAAT